MSNQQSLDQAGLLYRYLAWRGQENVDNEIRYYADAECGEDDLRDYRLKLALRDPLLEIRWSEDFSTAALRTCQG